MSYPFDEPQNHNKYIIRLQAGSVWMVGRAATKVRYTVLI